MGNALPRFDKYSLNNLLRYRTLPDQEQIENLMAFTRHGERVNPIAFAGRRELLDHVQRKIQDIRTDDDEESLTTVIHGAPGAGKTSLLNQFERMNRGDVTSVVLMEGEGLSNPVRVVESFLDAFGAEVRGLGDAQQSTHRTTGDLKLIRHEERWEAKRASLIERVERGGSPWGAVKELTNVERSSVFLFLVDEAQYIDVPPGKEVNEIVTNLHAGRRQIAGLRILPIFAGLADTVDKLTHAGLTRLSGTPHHLGVLSVSEAAEAVAGFMHDERMGLQDVFSIDDREELALSLAIACEGWPRHLHHYLQGFAQHLVDDFRRTPPNRGIYLNAILDYGNEQRFNYCEDRMRAANLGAFEDALKAFAMSRDVSEPISEPELLTFTTKQFGLPHDDISKALANAVHYGVLEPYGERADKLFRYPIPSMATYMQCEGRRTRTLDQLRIAFQSRMQDV